MSLLFWLASWAPFTILAPFVEPQRLERQDAGYAISLPLDWEHADAEEANPDDWWDPDKVDDVSQQHDQVIADGGLLLARPRSPFAHDFCILSDFTARAAEPMVWTSITHATTAAESLERDAEVIDAEAATLDLPAGRAVRIDTLWRDGWDSSSFYLTDGSTWFELSCGVEGVAADDRWQSIAETFEFLPPQDPGTAVPTPGPQRIERPEAGFAISLPYYWDHADADDLEPDQWYDIEIADDVEKLHEEALAGGLLLKARSWLPSEPALQWCDLADSTRLAARFPAWITIEDAEASFRGWSEDPDNISVEAAYQDLPAGRVLSVDSRWQGGRDGRTYVFTDGESWVRLDCATVGAAPDDRWLAIAETFEFVPVEE